VRGVTQLCVAVCTRSAISIHTPREGSDESAAERDKAIFVFQSTLPVRGVTKSRICGMYHRRYFNPHSP